MSNAFEFGRMRGAQETGREYRPFNPATQPLPESNRSIHFDEKSDIVKTPLKALGWMFQQPIEHVTEPLVANVAKLESSKAIQGNNALRSLLGVDPEMAADIRRMQNEGASVDEIYERRFQDNNVGRFITELVLDPLNLVGVGLVPKVAKGVGVGAKGVQNLQRGEDITNAVLAAPITLPVKAVKGTVKAVGGKALDQSGKRKAELEQRDITDLFNALNDAGVNIRDTDDLAALTPRVMADTLNSAAMVGRAERIIQNTDDALLGRSFDYLSETSSPAANDVATELVNRGLMRQADNGWMKTNKLRVHEELDEVADNFQFGFDERQAWKDVTDRTAEKVWSTNPRNYDSIDEVYGSLNYRRLTDLPDETGDELFKRLDRNNIDLEQMLDKFETKENLAELLRDPSVRNPGIWNWYARSGEFFYNMGFDHSRAFTDDQAQWILNQPQVQELIAKNKLDPAQSLERLQSISKIEAITQMIGAGSMNEGPKRNLYTALTGYRNLMEGRIAPLEGFRIPAVVQQKQGIQGPSIPSAYDFQGQWDKAYLGLLHPDGLLPQDWFKQITRTRAPIEYAGHAEGPVHEMQDKMFLFARTIREETDAYAAYMSALQDGKTAQQAAKIREDAREQIQGYVSDAWDRRGLYQLEGRLSDDVIEAGLVTNRVDDKGKPLPNKFAKKLEERKTSDVPSWFATKFLVHEVLYPYLTGKMPHGGAYSGATVGPEDLAMFRQRYTNPGALQADLWGRFRFREKNAVAPALKELAGDVDEFNRLLETGGPEAIRDRFGSLVRRFMDTDEYRAGQRAFSDESQDFLDVADYVKGFDNPEIVRETAPLVRTGEGYVTREGATLPYAGDDVVEAMTTGTYEPLLKAISDDLKLGMFEQVDNGFRISFFPEANLAAQVHETAGHAFRHMAGPQAQADIRRSTGQPVYRSPNTADLPMEPGEFRRSQGSGLEFGGRLDETANRARMSREAEEAFAEGMEGNVFERVPGNADEAAEAGRQRRLLELNYMREGAPSPEPRTAGFLDTESAIDPRAQRRIDAGEALPKDLRRADAAEARAQQAYGEAYESTQFSDPRADAPLPEILDQIAMESGLGMDAARRVSDEMSRTLQPFLDRNPQINAIRLWHNPNVKKHIQQAMRETNPQKAHRALEEAAYELDGIWASFGMNHPHLMKVVKTLLPKNLRDSVIVESTAYGRRASGSRLSDKQLRTKKNVEAMEEVNKVQKFYDRYRNLTTEIAESIHTQEPLARQIDDFTTYTDLQEIAKHADPAQRKVINDFLEAWSLPGLEPADVQKLTLRDVEQRDVLIAAQKNLAKKYGLKWDDTPAGLSKAFQRATRAWREQALFSPRYHAANGLDMAIKSAIFGINFANPPLAADKQLRLWGRNAFPAGVRVENVAPELGIMRTEFQSGESGVLTGVPVIGKGIQWSQQLARAMENSVREAAFAHGARDNLMRNMDSFHAQLRREMGDSADEVITAMSNTTHGVSFSPQQLADSIMTHGGDARTASRMSALWDNALNDAFEEGRGLSNLVHFDFGDERIIEAKLHLRKWAPFHFWATRNVPFYLDTLAANPHIIRIWQRYNNYAEREFEEDNLPRRLSKMVPLPGPMDEALDVLFGPGRSYFNPMVAMSFADQMKPRFEDQDQPWLGRQLDKLQYVGLAPAPWFSYPLSVLGAYGPDDEQFPALRHSSLVKDLTGLAGIDPFGTGGVDVEAPLRSATNRAREIVTGKEVQTISGSAYKDYQISKRLADMSIERTGNANHPEILKAMRDPDHPLYKEAARDVQKENFLTGMQHFLTPIPHKRITESEQLVRERQGMLPEGALADRQLRDRLVSTGDPAGAYFRTPKPKVLEPVKQDQYGNVQSNNQNSGRGSGTTGPQATTWGAGVWGFDSPPPFNNPNLYNFYMKRVQSRGFITPEQYVAELST